MSTLSLATRVTVLEELIEAVADYVPETTRSHNLETVAKVWLAELREEQGFREANPDVE